MQISFIAFALSEKGEELLCFFLLSSKLGWGLNHKKLIKLLESVGSMVLGLKTFILFNNLKI